MATETARQRRAVERAVATEFGRDRIGHAIFDVVADGLDLGPCAVRSPEERAFVRTTLATAIGAATDAALERLVADLASALASGPSDLVGRVLVAREEPEDDAELELAPIMDATIELAFGRPLTLVEAELVDVR